MDQSESGTVHLTGVELPDEEIAVSDVRRLHEVVPLAWSSYQFGPRGDEFVYKQVVGAGAGHDVGDVGIRARPHGGGAAR